MDHSKIDIQIMKGMHPKVCDFHNQGCDLEVTNEVGWQSWRLKFKS